MSRDARRPAGRRRPLQAAVVHRISPAVGWPMKARAGKKRVVLELGGNAGAIVDATRRPRLGRPADHGRRLQLLRPGLHQRPARLRPRRRLRRVRGQASSPLPARCSLGDPLDPETELGPMVDAKAAAPHAGLGGRGSSGWRRASCWAGTPRARSSRRPSWWTRRSTRRCARRRRSPRSSCSARFADFEDAVAQAQRLALSGSRRASSRTTSATHGGPSTGWRSAA